MKIRKIRLNKVQDVNRLLSRVINQVLSGELETARGNCVGQLANVLLRAMEKGEMESRIEELEKLLSVNLEDT